MTDSAELICKHLFHLPIFYSSLQIKIRVFVVRSYSISMKVCGKEPNPSGENSMRGDAL